MGVSVHGEKGHRDENRAPLRVGSPSRQQPGITVLTWGPAPCAPPISPPVTGCRAPHRWLRHARQQRRPSLSSAPGPLGFRGAPAASGSLSREQRARPSPGHQSRSPGPGGRPRKRGYLPATHPAGLGHRPPRWLIFQPTGPSQCLRVRLYLAVPGPSFTHKLEGWGPELWWSWTLGTGHRQEHWCPTGHMVTLKSSGHSDPVSAVWVTE